jgi:hypothetical protein
MNIYTFIQVSSWLPKVKLDQLLHMLDVVVPRVETLCSSGHLTSDHEILILLRSNELLKEVHPSQVEDTKNGNEEDKLEIEKTRLRMRPFQWNDRVAYWCRSLLWGHVYTMYRAPLGLWQGTAIQLFQVKSSTSNNSSTATTTVQGSQGNSTSTTNATISNEQTSTGPNTETNN